jgi:hypothetical protein
MAPSSATQATATAARDRRECAGFPRDGALADEGALPGDGG